MCHKRSPHTEWTTALQGGTLRGLYRDHTATSKRSPATTFNEHAKARTQRAGPGGVRSGYGAVRTGRPRPGRPPPGPALGSSTCRAAVCDNAERLSLLLRCPRSHRRLRACVGGTGVLGTHPLPARPQPKTPCHHQAAPCSCRQMPPTHKPLESPRGTRVLQRLIPLQGGCERRPGSPRLRVGLGMGARGSEQSGACRTSPRGITQTRSEALPNGSTTGTFQLLN